MTMYLEVIEKSIKCVVVGVSEHHTGASTGGLAVVSPLHLFTGL